MSAAVTPIVALDVGSIADALALVDRLGESCRYYKVGGELFTVAGPQVVRDLVARDVAVFLDLKFHDIPNTVRGAVRSAASLGVSMLTVHASGGTAMLDAAVAGAREAGSPHQCHILAVTVLTSLDAAALSSVWGRTADDVEAEVLRLAGLAADTGLHGVVCGGREAAAVRSRFGERLATLVPGVRLPGGDHQDQARVVTPAEAAMAGARYVVIGRAVTAAVDPRKAMFSVLADLP